jgi:hypothetical protein
MGLKVPPKPADKEIARLFMEGEEAEAMKRAATSNNPKDLEFYKVMAQTIMQSKKLDMLLNPQKYQQPQTGSIDKPDAAFIQSALQQGTGEGINAMMGMIPGGQSALGRVMPFSPTQQQPKVMPFDPTDKRFKAEIALLDKAMKQQENIIKALRDRSQSYGLSESQKKQLESELEREAKKLRTMQKNYLIKAEGGDPKKKRQEIFDKFNNLLDSGLKSLQPR